MAAPSRMPAPESIASEHPDLAAARKIVQADRGTAGARGEPRTSSTRNGIFVTSDGRKIPTEEVIESARTMLALNWTRGDIKRHFVKSYGGSGKTYDEYIAVARSRNLASLKRSPLAAKSDSMTEWTRLQRDAHIKRAKIYRQIEEYQAEIDRYSTLIRAETSIDEIERISGLRDSVIELMGIAEKSAISAEFRLVQYQNTIDKLLGNHAPIKIDTSGKLELSADIRAEIANPKEPLTAAEGDAMLVEMLAKVKEGLKVDAVSGVKDEVVKPSKN